MTYKENAGKIGQTVTIQFAKLTFDVVVKDYKHTYGRDRWLVSPVSGSGEAWVENIVTQ